MYNLVAGEDNFSPDDLLIEGDGDDNRVNLLFESTLVASPCKCRPDSGAPCPLIDLPKDNTVCDICSLKLGGPAEPDYITITYQLQRNEIRFLEFAKPTTGYCPFPGCDVAKNGTRYCRKHESVTRHRTKKYLKDNPGHTGPIPVHILHAPVLPRKR